MNKNILALSCLTLFSQSMIQASAEITIKTATEQLYDAVQKPNIYTGLIRLLLQVKAKPDGRVTTYKKYQQWGFRDEGAHGGFIQTTESPLQAALVAASKYKDDRIAVLQRLIKETNEEPLPQ
jgi:hypothetical protein